MLSRLVPNQGTQYQAPGSKYQVPGTRYWAPAPRARPRPQVGPNLDNIVYVDINLVPGTWYLALQNDWRK